jgi:probable phosphoglycerate mutase
MDSRPVTKIFSSTLMRAVETARMIGDRQHVDIYLVPGLIEVEFGKWEGMTWAEIKEQYPNEYERWFINPVEVAPPGGETQMMVMERVAGAIETVMGMTNGREDIAVVSHGATMAYIVAYLMRNHPEESEIIVDNASITTVNYNPVTQDYMLLEVNDTAHLHQ